VVFLLWRQIIKTGVTPTPMGFTSELPIPTPGSTSSYPTP